MTELLVFVQLHSQVFSYPIMHIFPLCPQTVQITPRLLGALTALSWVCMLAPSAKDHPATHDTLATKTADTDAQLSLSACQKLHVTDPKGDNFELAQLISQLPINLVVIKPDMPAKQNEHDGSEGGELEEEEGRSSIFKLTAARKKIEWGPLISHCYSCYWKCVLFTLKQLHPLDKDSCSLTNGRTNRAYDNSTQDKTSKASCSWLPHTLGPNLSGRCCDSGSVYGSEWSQRGQSLIPVGSNDVNAIIEACLSTGLDLADNEVPTVVECLCVLLPEVLLYAAYMYIFGFS